MNSIICPITLFRFVTGSRELLRESRQGVISKADLQLVVMSICLFNFEIFYYLWYNNWYFSLCVSVCLCLCLRMLIFKIQHLNLKCYWIYLQNKHVFTIFFALKMNFSLIHIQTAPRYILHKSENSSIWLL